jgi:N-glycosylase/DNA lyase
MRTQLHSSTPFNLDATLCCGQAFRWDKQGEWWYGIVKENAFKIRQVRSYLEFENANSSLVNSYFGLEDNLPRILRQVGKDKYIKEAIASFKGLRILRQDPWECLISYICATYKNVPAIRQMIFNLSRRFGCKIKFEEQSFYTFPAPKSLAEATLKDLVKCGLGYRARYVSETAKMVYESDFELDSLRRMSYEKAREELLCFAGIGLKVADCVSLFSLGKLEAFPIDVWIKRVILKHYSNHFSRRFLQEISDRNSLAPSEYRKLNSFGREYFGAYAGYAQEYLYHYERSKC